MDDSSNISSLIFTQLTTGAASAYLLQLIQKWRAVPWITEHTDGINRAVRVFMSFIAAIGISYAWSAGTADGSHVLSLTIPSWIALFHGIWHWFGQYALQHAWWKVFQIPISSPPVSVDKELRP